MLNNHVIIKFVMCLDFQETQCINESKMGILYSTLFTTTSAGFIGKLEAELSKCRLNNEYNNISHV